MWILRQDRDLLQLICLKRIVKPDHRIRFFYDLLSMVKAVNKQKLVILPNYLKAK